MNVLVVDDDKVDRIVVRELLEKEFTIFEAESGEALLKCLDSQQIDCILLDYLIPGTDSLELVGEISAKHLPVIMLTGEGNEHVAVNAMKRGAQDYINKRNLTEEFLSKTITNAVGTVELGRKLEEKSRELVVANDQLKRKVGELEGLNQDLENFIHIMAHDLREPIRNLYGYCGLLKREEGPKLSAISQQYINSIERGAKKLTLLIDDLRALTRVVYTKLDIEEVPLQEVISKVLEEINERITLRKVRIKQDLMPSLRCSRLLIEQLYMNLLGNALKYGDEAEMSIEITARNVDSQLVLGVKNSGSIIPPDDLERVFHPFYRLAHKRNAEGTGMGLTLCKKIVERHGGKIWIESSASEGVHIQFTLS